MNQLFHLLLLASVATVAVGQDLWQVARNKAGIHRYSTLITAQDVRDLLSSDEGISSAIDWSKRTGVTKVYLETYGDKYQAEQAALVKVRDRFRRAGFLVSGAITTTRIGKISNGWNLVSCYTNQVTQADLRDIVEFTAALFDEVILHDYWFTDCTCQECDNARKGREVRIREKLISVETDTWEDYRRTLMVGLTRERLIGPARRVNPRVKLIVKFPQWYDRYHERGYDVLKESQLFDRIWVGTETRDRDIQGGRVPYEGYFLMRWLTGIGKTKTGGGWIDSQETSEKTFVEQARQTVLGGARETLLYSYGAMQLNFGPADADALRPLIPELIEVSRNVRRRSIRGVAAYKPPDSHHEEEINVYDYVGMLGIPLAPCHEFPADALAAFFPVHALKDGDLTEKLSSYIQSGKPVLITDGLARRLSGKVSLGQENVHVLKVGGNPDSLLELQQPELDALRDAMLAPLKVDFDAPAEVSLYWFSDGSWVVENFAGRQVHVKLNGQEFNIGAREWVYQFR